MTGRGRTFCVWCFIVLASLPKTAWAWAEEDETKPEVPAPPQEDASTEPLSHDKAWEYALLATGVAGIVTGVTLITVEHARVNNYNLRVQAYGQGIDQNAATFQDLADLRDSINTGERWGYIAGSVGLAAALTAAVLYVTFDEAPVTHGRSAGLGIAPGLGTLAVYGRF